MEFLPGMIHILTSKDQLPASGRVWGTGGWLPPDQREALDWLSLVRFMGWPAQVDDVGTWSGDSDARCLILALDPERVNQSTADAIAALLRRRPILVVARGALTDCPLNHLSGAHMDS